MSFKHKGHLDKKKIEANESITVNKFRLIDLDGKVVGELSKNEALKIANERELDIVLVYKALNENEISVAKLVESASKVLYMMKKKEKEIKKNTQEVLIKKLQVRPCTDIGGVRLKVSQAKKFLEKRCQITFTMFFRKRERDDLQKGIQVMNEIASQLSDIAKIDSPPKVEGVRASMVLTNK